MSSESAARFAQASEAWLASPNDLTAQARLHAYDEMCRELGMDDIQTHVECEWLRRWMQRARAA